MSLSTRNLTRTSDYLAKALEHLGFIIMSQTSGAGLPLVAFRLDPSKNFPHDEFAIAHQLREHGWVVPAYTMAPHSEKLKLMRVVVREDFSRSRCDALITDIGLAMKTLGEIDPQTLKTQQEQKRKTMASSKGRSKVNGHYGKEKHSLQAKHGKSHPVC